MVSNQEYLYGDDAMVKIISDPGSVRLKVCPKIEERGEDEPPAYDEVLAAMSVSLDWFGCNLLIKQIRTMRDKTFGKPE